MDRFQSNEVSETRSADARSDAGGEGAAVRREKRSTRATMSLALGQYIDRGELQERLGLSARGLDSWLSREGIRTFRLSGRTIRFLVSEVEQALSRAAERPATPASGAVGAQLEAVSPRRHRTAV